MGWLHFARTRKELIADLVAPEARVQTLRYCVRGNVLWSVRQYTTDDGNTHLCIDLDLMAKRDGIWGYKAMGESCFPFYYTCPLAYLELVPVANEEWRVEVRAYHAGRRS